jgi:heme exporter protein A
VSSSGSGASNVDARNAPVALEIDGVWKYFGDFPALRDVGFKVTPGSVVALLGRNGAGKTTLLRILAGLSKPSRGAVLIHGESTRLESTRRRIGVLGHAISLYDELSAAENLEIFGRLYNLPNPPKRAGEMLERIGLERVRDGLVREFSRGMRQRLAVGRAFLHEPQLLLLDEPFTALDDRAIAVLQSMLKERRQKGATIVMSTHQLREALELATHVALLLRGQIAFAGERRQEMLDDTGWLYRTFGDEPRSEGTSGGGEN